MALRTGLGETAGPAFFGTVPSVISFTEVTTSGFEAGAGGTA